MFGRRPNSNQARIFVVGFSANRLIVRALVMGKNQCRDVARIASCNHLLVVYVHIA